ncbi:MAG: lipid-A-disaccharide synthase [Bacteroidetes bacterium]|nr:MAG: lipid-A-disaccharide synthase [Bacteroidota bacterium]
MKYYIIAGEASGDLHASNLIRALKKQDADADIRAWGGDLMEEQGVKLVKHYRDLAFMGFVEVLFNLRTIFKNIRFCKKDILEWKPDVLILVDYPGFNLRIAEFAHKKGLKVIYYISPQVWAWKKSRVYAIKKHVDKMLVILPFEKDFYADYGYPVEFVGHPLLDALPTELSSKELFIKENALSDKPIIALLPGSRKQEIRKMLKIMLGVIDSFSTYQFVIAGAPSIDESFYNEIIGKRDVAFVKNNTQELLLASTAALVTSGTATLETALLNIPEVVCYKGSNISYQIAKRLVDIKYISLVNLIMDKEVVKELIQGELTSGSLKLELNKILPNAERRKRVIADYQKLKLRLGKGGASAKAASSIIRFLNP